MNNQKGFSLVELLVVLGIVVTVGALVANLFLANLRTAAKTKALTEIKQNGDYALAVLERMIRNSKEVQSGCPGIGPSLTILNQDDNSSTFLCESTRIASGGAALISNNFEIVGCDSAFDCDKPEGRPAVVTISFSLKQKGSSLGQEFTAEVPFQTTVSTRTY
jgi:prepilin-type N-terminal cleavage/methylation domain-containing protein